MRYLCHSSLAERRAVRPCDALSQRNIDWMKKRSRRISAASPLMMAQLAAASWETIFRRSVMMAQGTCSPAEYQRMVSEKAAAMRLSTQALLSGRGGAAVMAPFLSRASRNAKRLRSRS
jgi:hypothetical protein